MPPNLDVDARPCSATDSDWNFSGTGTVGSLSTLTNSGDDSENSIPRQNGSIKRGMERQSQEVTGIRDAKREIRRTLLRKKVQADTIASVSIRRASEALDTLSLKSKATDDAPTDAELKVYVNYRSAVVEHAQQQAEEPDNHSDARSIRTTTNHDEMFRGFLELNARCVQPKVTDSAEHGWLIELVRLRGAGGTVLKKDTGRCGGGACEAAFDAPIGRWKKMVGYRTRPLHSMFILGLNLGLEQVDINSARFL
ncbi:hypothetical protein ARMGADRAFT_1030497 [Armillaria gallica]|uniref:Uncharacterized protein n=1 Tax=Armillaria gallica TaxID=47427 RepID=A0A2H3DGW9_ARMGA|nr:hypothetical protein ARMGADRAFT_1030497 [Armillaria gallica]